MGGSRSANEVMRAVLDRAVEVAKERRMGAPELNDGGFEALIDQVFKELNPPEFASREDLDAQHAQEATRVELFRGNLWGRIAPDDCPDLEVLGGYETGELGLDDQARVGAHVENCDLCLDFVGLVEDWDRPSRDPKEERNL